MAFKIRIGIDINKEEWEQLFRTSHYSSPFQLKSWAEFVNSLPNQEVKTCSFFNKSKLKALMSVSLMKEPGVKGFFSRRGIVFGGPVLHKDITNEELIFFLQKVSGDLKGKAIYLETRNFFDYSLFKEAFKIAGWNYEPYLNFQLQLDNIETLLSKFKYNRRREIKQSIAEGATYGLCENEKEIEAVYSILNDLYRTKVKLPLPSYYYFLGLYRENLIKVLVVKHHNKIIGGSFCPFLPSKAIYTYYYCGLRNYNKKIFPTHLAVLAVMEYAIDNNIPMIDFMGAGRTNQNYGVRDYKSQFGGKLVEHGRFIKVLNPFLYVVGKLGLKVLSKLK